MPDILIRDVPQDVLVAIDSHAARLGLSRSEYLCRLLAQDARRSAVKVTLEDLQWVTGTFGDLTDSKVVHQAWS